MTAEYDSEPVDLNGSYTANGTYRERTLYFHDDTSGEWCLYWDGSSNWWVALTDSQTNEPDEPNSLIYYNGEDVSGNPWDCPYGADAYDSWTDWSGEGSSFEGECPTSTGTPTTTISGTPTTTISGTPTTTISDTPTPSVSDTPTVSSTPTPTVSDTPTVSSTPTPTVSDTPTPSVSATPTSSATPTATEPYSGGGGTCDCGETFDPDNGGSWGDGNYDLDDYVCWAGICYRCDDPSGCTGPCGPPTEPGCGWVEEDQDEG